VLLDVGSVPATGLTLFLKGVDELTIWKPHVKRNRMYFKKETFETQFAKVRLSLKNFEKQCTPQGKTSYPFQMMLPADLPPSTFCKSARVKSLQAKVRYFLVAEITGGAENLSHQHEVTLTKPMDEPRQATFATENKVGGYFGVG
jgi:hypothetical protein